MDSIIPSVSGRLWLEQIRRATPGPFARFRNQLNRILEERSRDSAADGRTVSAIEPGLLRAFDAACRDDPLTAEQVLAELIDGPPPEPLMATLLAACAVLRPAPGRCSFDRRPDHTARRTLGVIH